MSLNKNNEEDRKIKENNEKANMAAVELSDDALEQISGGEGYTAVNGGYSHLCDTSNMGMQYARP